ncbi:MAG: superoxide dismutase [Candidatus Saccharimonas sp.]
MYTLPGLGYAYDALSPIISEQVMQLHHQKHHQTYIDKLNAALEGNTHLQQLPLISLLEQVESLPDSVRTAVRNHGGGHYNHSLFWQCMAPGAGGEPSGDLRHAITKKWGGFDLFTNEFNTKATGLFGSGWVWLTQELEIVVTPNQDNPIMAGAGEPLMGLDVWEHAYYLDYKNKRDDYIKNWWQVVNWDFIEGRYNNSMESLR